jgi:predicted amidophosphoribosyltransferase
VDALRAAGELAEASERATVLIPAPASSRARRRRGFDHVRDVVDALAADLAGSVPGGPVAVAPVLEVRGRVRDAAGLDARSRSDNLAGRIRRRPGSTPIPASPGAPRSVAELLASPATVLLVDDVATTGATAAACVDALGAGGLRVDGVLTVTAA